jgi:hypothetical protein
VTPRTAPSGDKADRPALREHLDELLATVNVINGWPDLTHYELIAALLSVRSPWRPHLTPIDLFSILARALRRRGIRGPETTGQRLIKLVDAESFNALRSEIEEYLLSFPRQYNLWVVLPAMPRWGAGSVRQVGNSVRVEIQPIACGPCPGKGRIDARGRKRKVSLHGLPWKWGKESVKQFQFIRRGRRWRLWAPDRLGQGRGHSEQAVNQNRGQQPCESYMRDCTLRHDLEEHQGHSLKTYVPPKLTDSPH